jgi:hypothetical protein
VAFLQAILSGVLYHRVQYFYSVITWKWAQWLLDWCYRLLPKNSELIDIATSHYTPRNVWEGWWPVWSTAVFMAVACAWAYWRFQRKAL